MEIILDRKIVSDLRGWFTEYVNRFKDHDKELQLNIEIKREHTERVTREIINIGKELSLNDNELNLAEIIALFHDIGRFQQYKRYKTFSDSRSENHAELGIKILKSANVLGMLNQDLQELVFCSIKYHNRPSLPDWETGSCLYYSRLIRDADKLDIWRVVTNYYHRNNNKRNIAIELELPDTPGISEEVYESIMNRQIVNIRNVRNINDIKLLQAGWIFDINFSPSFGYIKKRRYIELLRQALPESDKIDSAFGLISTFLESKCQN